jgi:hypothetical protein
MLFPHPAGLPPAPAAGLAVGDVDGDTRPELLLIGPALRVLRWANGGVRDAAPVGPAAGRLAAAAADIDGDGAEEVYLPAGSLAGPADQLLKLHPENRWLDLLDRAARGPAPARAAAALDRRGDGRFGFVVGSDGWPVRLLEADESGRIIDRAASLGMAPVLHAAAVLAAPLTGSATDVFVAAADGANRLYRDRGDGTFEDVAKARGAADAGESAGGAGRVDFGGAGGLCWVNTDGPHRLLDAAGRDAASPAFALPSAARGVVVADFDNDGWEELVVLNRGEPNRLFRLIAGDVVRLDAGAIADVDASAAVVMDLDRDGVPELVLATPDGVSVFAARPVGGWLRVVPRTRFGAPARGATVTAEVGGRVVSRAIDAGPHEPVAHVGLGAEPAATRVTVTWPDGSALTLRDPDANCTYDVPYPTG